MGANLNDLPVLISLCCGLSIVNLVQNRPGAFSCYGLSILGLQGSGGQEQEEPNSNPGGS